MKSWARDFALGLLLATAIPAAVSAAAPSAEQILLDKVNYWRLKDRPDLATEALQKLLSINPNNQDAVFQSGMLAVQQNKPDDARAQLAKLRQLNSSSPHIADLENAIRAGQVSPNELGEARRLAQAGQFSQAAAKYEQTFKGPPPPTFGIEYYQTLAGTPQGWPEARKGLERLTQTSPNDAGAKLALAEVLTYHGDTRGEGIRELSQLANDSVVGGQAVQSWKKALMWLGTSASDRALYNQYLAKYGQDQEIREHIAQVEKGAAPGVPGTPGPGSATAGGYSDLNRGNLGAAERQFQATLSRSPGDADALAGLGLIRLREQRFGEAQQLLGRAMQAAPSRRGQWATAYDTAVFWSNFNAAKSARDSGDYQRARSILSRLAGGSGSNSLNAEQVLGDVDQKLGDYAGAEAAYKRVLAARPDDADANVGLYTVLTAQGKTVEAATISARLATLDPTKLAGLNRARADVTRNEGKTLQSRGDAAGAQAKYQEAIAVDPTDAWARLDLARFFAVQGNTTQAFVVINPAASGNTAESFQAAAIFYSEQNRFQDAVAALDAIPAGSRNADVTAFRERMLMTAEIGRAKQLARAGNRAAARNILLALNSRPPNTQDKTRAITDALADIGDFPTALQLARPTSTTDKKAVLDYAALLQRAGRESEATAYLAQAEAGGRVTAGNKQELEQVKGEIAAKRADQLRERGDLAGAWDQISPLLMAYPNEPTLLLAAGRIYGSAGQGDMAMRFVDAAYQQKPTDLGVIQGAIGAAIVAGDLDRARAYLAQAMQISPNNPRLYFMQAEIARAAGDNGSAVYDLSVARSLNMQQAGSFEPLPPLPGTRAVPGGPPSTLPPNPFRRSEAEMPQPTVQTAAMPGPPAQADEIVRPAVQTAAMPKPVMQLAQATPVIATDATSARPSAPAPLQETATSADSDDLAVPPHLNERPPRPVVTARSATPRSVMQIAAASGPMSPPQVYDAAIPTAPQAPQPGQQLAQLPPLPPPPLPGYQAPNSAYGGYYAQPQAQAPLQPYGAPPPAPGYAPQRYAPQGYAPSGVGLPAPVPQDSLELDIERSMNAIAAESAPTIQGGLSVRDRSGEYGLSRLTEISAPIEGTFSPFFDGQARLQMVPTFLDAGTASNNALLRFGHEPLLALPGSGFTSLRAAGGQDANGVALNAAYTYQMFSGEIGTTPLGFPIENLVGRLALTWPGPGANTTAFPMIGLAPTTVSNPLQVKVEVNRQAITESVLSYAGTRDPITGQLWGGAIKTGGNVLVSYDDGEVGVYGGGGYSRIDGRSIPDNSEREALVGAYVRPYRSGNSAFKIGVNFGYMGFDKNLRFFTFGQGGYFSPQTYVNISVPMEYSGRTGRFTYLVGGALGVQKFNENSSPIFPLESGFQAASAAAFGTSATYPSRSVTSIAFGAKGQLEYQLDNGFSIGGLASVDNAQNYTEVIGKVYLRKSFGASLPASVWLPHANALPGSL